MVERSADRRASATEALAFPVIAQPLDVRSFFSILLARVNRADSFDISFSALTLLDGRLKAYSLRCGRPAALIRKRSVRDYNTSYHTQWGFGSLAGGEKISPKCQIYLSLIENRLASQAMCVTTRV